MAQANSVTQGQVAVSASPDYSPDVLRFKSDLWDKTYSAWGTAAIFENKADRLRLRLQLLDIFGIVFPVLIGSLALLDIPDCATVILKLSAGILGVIELVGSVLCLVLRWQDRFSYALESKIDNYDLAQTYEFLAKSVNDTNLDNSQQRLNILDERSRYRTTEDQKQQITEAEKRMGKRSALLRYQSACPKCDKIPFSMEPSDCPMCGNFKRRRL